MPKITETPYRVIQVCIVGLFLAAGVVFSPLISQPANQWVFILLAVFTGLCISWAYGEISLLRRSIREREAKIETGRARCMRNQRRLDGVLKLTREINSNPDEKHMLFTGLEIVSELTGAFAAAYISLDEHEQQAMPVIVHGTLPAEVLQKWAEHLESPIVRNQCKRCSEYSVISSEDCKDFQGPYPGPFKVHIFPFCRNERRLGVMQLYCDPDLVLNQEDQDFLSMMVGEMVIIFQSLKLRNQEVTILRQLQKLNTSHSGLDDLLDAMMGGLLKVLEMDYAMIQIHAQEHAAAWKKDFGLAGEFPADEINQIASQASRIQGMTILPQGNSVHPAGQRVIAVPLLGKEGGETLGVLIVAGKQNGTISEEQAKAVMTISRQAALMIENDRFRMNLEYRAIIEERVHLAREIHDGLAQELAFLKIQSYQAYHHLLNGEDAAAREMMKEQNQVLSKAYLDVRQVIDNLRMTPEQGLAEWLKQAAADLRETSGIPVFLEMNVLPNDGGLPLEVQAQLIRIVQETFTNIRKHANASHVDVKLDQTDDTLRLEISDDGQGFSPENMQGVEKHGLKGIYERAGLIGARVEISSRPGQGTTVSLRLSMDTMEVKL